MRVLYAVLKDLYTFVCVYLFGLDNTISASTEPSSSSAPKKEAYSSTQKVPDPVDVLPAPPTPHLLTSGVRLMGVGYARFPDTYLHALPTRTFDGVIAHVPYGASVQILGTQGKWCNVAYGEIHGWMRRDDITENSIQLKPQFVAGEIYDAEHRTTVQLRTLIDDAFHAAQLSLLLQDVEYVTYVLHEKRKRIPWGTIRPRIAGTWQRLLKGTPGVHIGVNPKQGTVMEYVREDNTGHVAYVDSVYPDGGITISEIGCTIEGVYSEQTLDKDERKELRPVFIEIA